MATSPPAPRVLCACIDIGSNTTRLLVAERLPDGLREVDSHRVFTELGHGLRTGGRVPPARISELVRTVEVQVSRARACGAGPVRAVGTAALRRAENRDEVCAAIRESCGVEVEILSAAAEARLAWRGATRNVSGETGAVAVVDVGGGSSEIIVGRAGGEVEWVESLPIGSGDLTAEHVREDPPGGEELTALRAAARSALGVLAPPASTLALAVGGSATSLGRLAGDVLDSAALERALRAVTAAPAADVARLHDLDPRRVRLLPAGILVLAAAAELLGRPLRVAPGGLREGVLLDSPEVPHP